MSAYLWAALLTYGCASASNTSTVVGLLGGHKSTAWASSSSCMQKGNDTALIVCNLQVYDAAAAAAASAGAELLVYPEAYALAGSLSKNTFFELLQFALGDVPCRSAGSVGAASAPQQVALSCTAQRHNVALAANLFTQLSNGTNHITEIVFGADGAIRSVYHKVHLFPTEKSAVQPGPFRPTTFDLNGHTWGIIICYEGVYPSLTGNYAQMDALVASGANAFAWSIGGDLPMSIYAPNLAKRYHVSVAATQQGKTPVAVGRDGKKLAATDVALHDVLPAEYTGKASVRIATVSW